MFTERLLFVRLSPKPFVCMIFFNPYDCRREYGRILPPFSRWKNSEVVAKDHLWDPCRLWPSEFLKRPPPFLFFLYSFIRQTPIKGQESHRGDFHSRLRVGSVSPSLQSLAKEKRATAHLIPIVSPNDLLSIHLSIHLLTLKFSICFVQVLDLGSVLRRSTMKKMKNAFPAAHSSWNPRGHQQCIPFSPFLDGGRVLVIVLIKTLSCN